MSTKPSANKKTNSKNMSAFTQYISQTLTKKYDIAVWCNEGQPVAFVKQLTAPYGKVYRYDGETPWREYDDEHLIVLYQCGCNANMQIMNDISTPDNDSGKSGVFIIKKKNQWIKLGDIIYAERVNNHPITNMPMMKLKIKKENLQLASNKRDALTVLGNYVKQQGKGTGNFMRGVCRIN